GQALITNLRIELNKSCPPFGRATSSQISSPGVKGRLTRPFTGLASTGRKAMTSSHTRRRFLAGFSLAETAGFLQLPRRLRGRITGNALHPLREERLDLHLPST